MDERAGSPCVWQVVDGHAQPVPMEVVSLDTETARIQVGLPPTAHVIALGTHLLTPGMAVGSASDEFPEHQTTPNTPIRLACEGRASARRLGWTLNVRSCTLGT